MKKKIDLTFLTTAVHLIAVLSAVCFGTIYLSLGILLIPALTSAFLVGKDVIYKQFDVYDSLSKRFFRQLKEEMHTMRYFPIQLVFVLQAVGIYAAGRYEGDRLSSSPVYGVPAYTAYLYNRLSCVLPKTPLGHQRNHRYVFQASLYAYCMGSDDTDTDDISALSYGVFADRGRDTSPVVSDCRLFGYTCF